MLQAGNAPASRQRPIHPQQQREQQLRRPTCCRIRHQERRRLSAAPPRAAPPSQQQTSSSCVDDKPLPEGSMGLPLIGETLELLKDGAARPRG
jgi:hypothetical protein